MDPSDLFFRTFLIGLAVAAPVGAMAVLCVQRTLDSGWPAGMMTGLGIASADATYAAIAAFGVAAVSQALVAWQVPLRIVGGAVLVYLGIRALLRPPAKASPAAGSAHPAMGSSHWLRYHFRHARRDAGGG